MKETRQKVLLTGARGMLGWAATKELNLDYQLIGIDIEDADISDESQIKEEIFKIQPDVVVHTAAYTEVDNCEKNKELTYRVNAKGAENVAQACKLSHSKLIYISTDFVFDGKKNSPYTEEDATNPINTYGWSKLEGEKQIQSILQNYLIVRTAWLYGPHGRNFVDTILQKASSQKELTVVDDQIGCPTYTTELARALGILIKKNPIGIVNVTNTGACSWYDFAKRIVELRGLPTTITPIKSNQLDRLAKRPSYSVLSPDKFKSLAGCTLQSWDEALKEYLL